MMRHRLILLALGLFVAVSMLPSIAEAQSNDFHALYNRVKFHQLSLSARSVGMGGAYSALSGGEMGLTGNPAALGFLEVPFVMLEGDIEDIASDLTFLNPNAPVEGEAQLWSIGVGGAYPLEWGTVGLQYAYRNDELESEAAPSALGLIEQDGDLDRNILSVAFAHACYEDLAFGTKLTYIDWDSTTDINVTRPAPFQLVSLDEDFSGFRGQFGLQYLAHPQLTLGLDGYFGLGERDSNALGDADADSMSIRGGLAWQAVEDIPLLIALDISYDNFDLDGGGNDTDEDLIGIHLGAEYEVYENLFLRAGYQFEDYDYDDSSAGVSQSFTVGGYSVGLGYHYEQFTFDYAFMYVDTGSADLVHYFGVGYEF